DRCEGTGIAITRRIRGGRHGLADPLFGRRVMTSGSEQHKHTGESCHQRFHEQSIPTLEKQYPCSVIKMHVSHVRSHGSALALSAKRGRTRDMSWQSRAKPLLDAFGCIVDQPERACFRPCRIDPVTRPAAPWLACRF
ncbi:MAG: hypothetical protein PF446_04540, partial [Oleiagrimonas sp.]|nr:hypothetical protein [Oleiagrimonas sp.]